MVNPQKKPTTDGFPIIFRNGKVCCIMDDCLESPLSALLGPKTLGKSRKRASHVEPHSGGGWVADLYPAGGPLLGPFRFRWQALAAEVAWLIRHRLKL